MAKLHTILNIVYLSLTSEGEIGNKKTPSKVTEEDSKYMEDW